MTPAYFGSFSPFVVTMGPNAASSENPVACVWLASHAVFVAPYPVSASAGSGDFVGGFGLGLGEVGVAEPASLVAGSELEGAAVVGDALLAVELASAVGSVVVPPHAVAAITTTASGAAMRVG